MHGDPILYRIVIDQKNAFPGIDNWRRAFITPLNFLSIRPYCCDACFPPPSTYLPFGYVHTHPYSSQAGEIFFCMGMDTIRIPSPSAILDPPAPTSVVNKPVSSSRNSATSPKRKSNPITIPTGTGANGGQRPKQSKSRNGEYTYMLEPPYVFSIPNVTLANRHRLYYL